MDAAQPLGHLTVIEICHSAAGPFAGQILAGLGADVIKVERPGGGDDARRWGPPFYEGAATAFHALNHGKRSIVVDLKSVDEVARLRKIIVETADVVLQNLRPGSLAAVGLDGDELVRDKPSLIFCNIGAFGATGPLRDKPGYDPLMQARGGLMSVTGEYGGGPVRIGTSIVDLGTGMWSAIGVLAALERRRVTGGGCVVDSSLFETAVSWMSFHMAAYFESGEIRRPMGSALPEIVPHQAFVTSDGRLMVAAGNDRLFARLVESLLLPHLAADARFQDNGKRVSNRQILIPILERAFLTETTQTWADRLDQAGVPCAPLQSVDQVAQDEQALALGLYQATGDPPLKLVGMPLSFGGARPPLRQAGPALGQHQSELWTAHETDAGAAPRESKRAG